MTGAPQLRLLAIFIVSRLLYFAAGVRFDMTPLNHYFQIVDPLLMKTRLLETMYYLHTQPPGFNFLLGIVVKFFPAYSTAIFYSAYLICGASLCWTLYGLMRILDVRPSIAFALTALFLISPGVVLFENFLMYEYPLMALLALSALALYRLFQRPSFGAATVFFAALTVLIYLRALFQLGWFVLIAAAVTWLLKGRRRTVLLAAAIPFALILALYLKNEVIIGSFSTSSWLGFNADTITVHQLTPEEHERLVRKGLLSKVGLIPSTETLDKFSGIAPVTPPTGIPVLDQLTDSNGRVNYNNVGYLPLHRYYIDDAKAIVLHYPRAYLRSIVRAAFTYFLPTGDFPFFVQNGPRVERFNRIFDVVFFGQWKTAANRKDLRAIEAAGGTAQLPLYTGTYLLIGLPLIFCLGVMRLRREVWRRPWTPSAALLAYVLFQIAYVTAVVCLLSCFENNRYRLPIDPFFVVLLGIALERGVRAFQSRSGRTLPTSALPAA